MGQETAHVRGWAKLHNSLLVAHCTQVAGTALASRSHLVRLTRLHMHSERWSETRRRVRRDVPGLASGLARRIVCGDGGSDGALTLDALPGTALAAVAACNSFATNCTMQARGRILNRGRGGGQRGTHLSWRHSCDTRAPSASLLVSAIIVERVPRKDGGGSGKA